MFNRCINLSFFFLFYLCKQIRHDNVIKNWTFGSPCNSITKCSAAPIAVPVWEIKPEGGKKKIVKAPTKQPIHPREPVSARATVRLFVSQLNTSSLKQQIEMHAICRMQRALNS